jgi:hypothetical protein
MTALLADSLHFLILICPTSPLLITLAVTCFYTLDLAAKASVNPWGASGLEVVETLEALKNKYQNFSQFLNAAQRRCIRDFVAYVKNHAAFFFCEDIIVAIEAATEAEA